MRSASSPSWTLEPGCVENGPIANRLAFPAEEMARAIQCKTSPEILFTRMDIGDEGFDAIRDELDGPPDEASNRDGRDLVGVKVDLNAERAPDMRTHHPDAPFAESRDASHTAIATGAVQCGFGESSCFRRPAHKSR